MTISVHRATPYDLDALLLLMSHMQNDDPWSEPFDELIVRKNLQELLQDPRFGLIYVARDEQVYVGYLVICFDFSLEYRGKGAWIDELFVEPSHRGQGIGTRLLDLAESASREHGAQTLHLEVNHGNRAVELYRRRSFNSRFSNKLLVMVDGRTVYLSSFGGVFYEVLDVPLEQIARIEVIRGPGGSIWGTNAVNGVINILTKKASATPGTTLVASGGSTNRGGGSKTEICSVDGTAFRFEDFF
jgi:ribosomal protein S18 acetylase RimI-like enzyme